MSEHQTWYIIDTRTNEIINAVSTAGGREGALRVAGLMIGGERLTVNDRPPLSQLQRYRYWSERP